MTKKILICDDDQGILDLMSFALEAPDTVIITEIDSMKAIARIRQEQPDLLLLDLWMPVLSGDHVLRQLKNDPELKNMPVIVLSASRDGHQIAKSAGADAYLAKPFDIDQLLDLVEQYLQHQHLDQ